MSVTCHGVVPFVRDEAGDLVPRHAGAVAFSRTGDPATGEFGDAPVIAVHAAVDVAKLEG